MNLTFVIFSYFCDLTYNRDSPVESLALTLHFIEVNRGEYR